MKQVNTTAEQFKLITDKKDEPDYKAVSKFVGGMVEVVQFPNGDLLLLNEEGKLMGLPLNPEATALWRTHFTKETHSIWIRRLRCWTCNGYTKECTQYLG